MIDAFVGTLVVYGVIIVAAQACGLLNSIRLSR
jgi:hypothetical protein